MIRKNPTHPQHHLVYSWHFGSEDVDFDGTIPDLVLVPGQIWNVVTIFFLPPTVVVFGFNTDQKEVAANKQT